MMTEVVSFTLAIFQKKNIDFSLSPFSKSSDYPRRMRSLITPNGAIPLKVSKPPPPPQALLKFQSSPPLLHQQHTQSLTSPPTAFYKKLLFTLVMQINKNICFSQSELVPGM